MPSERGGGGKQGPRRALMVDEFAGTQECDSATGLEFLTSFLIAVSCTNCCFSTRLLYFCKHGRVVRIIWEVAMCLWPHGHFLICSSLAYLVFSFVASVLTLTSTTSFICIIFQSFALFLTAVVLVYDTLPSPSTSLMCTIPSSCSLSL